MNDESKRRILIVENDEQLLNLDRVVLGGRGYEVVGIKPAAIDSTEEEFYAVVAICNDWELLETIGRIKAGRRIIQTKNQQIYNEAGKRGYEPHMQLNFNDLVKLLGEEKNEA